MCKLRIIMSTRNLTVALESQLIEEAKKVAKQDNLSLTGLIRKLLKSAVYREPSSEWINDFLDACNDAEGDSKGKRWKREDLYER
jgi:hypothetical protein